METIQEAKEYLRQNWENGVNCPCCKQTVRLYKFKLNSGMAKILIEAFNVQRQEHANYVHIQKRFNPKNGDYAKLRHWGLLESANETSEDGNDNGLWTVTKRGQDFIYGNIDLPEKAYLFNSRCFGFSGKQVSITEALANKFSYIDLMLGYVKKTSPSVQRS